MVVNHHDFWWENHSCLANTVLQHDVLPLCQHAGNAASTTSEPPTPIATLFECPAGWTQFENHCYIAKNTVLCWAEANKSCLSLGGNLTSIHSRAELDFVGGLLPGYSFWIGGTRDGLAEWTWTDGSVWDYELWYQENSGTSSQCVLSYGSNGFYNYICDLYTYPFICKIYEEI
jgi:hypothetical protein